MALPDGRPSLHDLNPARYSNVPAKGSGARGGNPNHDEHGRFT